MSARRLGGSFRGPRRARSTIDLDGIRFARAQEAQRYSELRHLERHGKIRVLELRCRPMKVDGLSVFAGRFTYVDAATGETKTETTRANKFSAEKVEVDGIRFDSRREARRYRQLRLVEQAGTIADIERQVPFVIHAHGGKAVAKYVLDFRYRVVATGERKHEDAKGVRTPVFNLKRKLIEAEYGIQIIEV